MPAWISCAPFEQHLAMEIIRAEAGEAVLTMPFLKQFAQGAGLMHGGALVSLADTAVVMAIKSVVAPGTHFATISMESRYLYPVKKGTLEARAVVVGREGRMLKGACDILDDADRTVMKFTSVFKIARNAAIRGNTFSTPSPEGNDD
jgi:uncharacterized protein (TIGR00369 family)